MQEPRRRGNVRRKASQALEVEERRRRVAELARERKSGTEIARELDVSEATVSRDLAEWRARCVEDGKRAHAERVGEELAVLDEVEGGLVASFRQKLDAQDKARVAAAIVKCHEQRAKVLGLYAPTKTEAKVEGHVLAERTELERLMANPAAAAKAHELAVLIYGPEKGPEAGGVKLDG